MGVPDPERSSASSFIPRCAKSQNDTPPHNEGSIALAVDRPHQQVSTPLSTMLQVTEAVARPDSVEAMRRLVGSGHSEWDNDSILI